MKGPKELLGAISAGRVLDVATGTGGFVHFMLEGLKDFDEITAIDTNPRAAAAFEEGFKDHPNVHFQAMDALRLDFPDASFDTLSIANSLHHFDDPQAVLREMERVLRPGGRLLFAEMYRDGQSETQLTHVYLHHWWAAVDRASGICHNETFRRDELLALLGGWCDLQVDDLSDTSEDPKNPEIQAELGPVIDRYIQRAEGHPELQSLSEDLRRRVAETGFHSATTLFVLARKKAGLEGFSSFG